MEAIAMRNLSSTTSMIRKNIQPSKRVCRSLFGPVDHEEVKAQLDFELEKDLSEKNKEWSFDFREGTPMSGGSFVWEEVKKTNVESQSETPQAIINEDRRVPELHPEINDPENDVFLAPSNVEEPRSISTRSTTADKPSRSLSTTKMTETVGERKRKRPCKTITDFMKQKKRRRVSYSSMEKNTNSKTDFSSNGHSVKDDLVMSNTAKKAKTAKA